MDDLGQLIIFFMCAAIFGMGSTYLFQCIKAEHRELGTKAFWTELEASEHIN